MEREETDPSFIDVPCVFHDKSTYKLKAMKLKDMDIIRKKVLKTVTARSIFTTENKSSDRNLKKNARNNLN